MRASLWKTRVEAFGDNCIIALDIDAAGPAIAANASDILREGCGPRFAIEFRTQCLDSKGYLVEVFDIMAHAATSDHYQPMSHASVGERVWLNGADQACDSGVVLFSVQKRAVGMRGVA